MSCCDDDDNNDESIMKNMSHSKHSSKEAYTCPMHPEVVSDSPGNCPKCGMNLMKSEEKDE